jgi:multidrug transporter EmrE-like cation transporter
MSYILLIISILFNAGSGVLYKYSAADQSVKSKILLLIGYACGAISALLYAKSLDNLSLGVVASVSSASVVLLSSAAGILLFGEYYSIQRLIGAVLICIGIFLVVK